MSNTQFPTGAAHLDDAGVTQYIKDTFENVETDTAMGYIFFFYDGDHKQPFATLAAEDNDYDRVSNLNRPSVFRLNIGVGNDTYRAMFGPQPALGADGIVHTGHDFTTLNQIMPHPVYSPQSWVCVLNPDPETFRTVQALLAEAYDRAVKRNTKRQESG